MMRGVTRQCEWVTPHGDGFLCCGHNAGHEMFRPHEDVYQTHGTAMRADPDTDQRPWFPEWFYRPVMEQERARALRWWRKRVASSRK